MNKKPLALAAATLFSLAAAAPAVAGSGDWEVYFGALNINPKSDNGSLANGTLDVEVDSNTRPHFGVRYGLTDAWVLDLLAAFPYKHEFSLNGANAGEFKHLPPTLLLQYHFNPNGQICPFVGVGLNYTYVYDEDPAGPIATADLKLDNSFGVAAQVGIEFKINDNWSIGGEVRWFDIDSDAEVNGADLGTVNVDPIAPGIFAVYRF